MRIFQALYLATLLASLSVQVAAQDDRSVLPVPPKPFAGSIGETVRDSTPNRVVPVEAPDGAPNIFLFMADDVGFSMSSTFGGPIPTPNMDKLARLGQRYNSFHTTAICSPSRAALLTGRNHHNAGTGHIADLALGFPGYTARIPRSTATIAEVLKHNGYNTAMFGKHHNIPPGEQTVAGPFDSWPTGLGFEYYFGFINGDSDQFSPRLHRGTNLVREKGMPGELLDKRLADDTIFWARNQKTAAPDKPFFIYFAPGSTHAPHQAPKELIARYKGKFDQGWDRVREETWQRQLDLGIIPEETKLTERPDEIAAWTALSPVQQKFAARGMEVAAAMLEYQDEQLGRILDEFERMGIFDNTLFVIIQGDNGASGDGDLAGLVSEFSFTNGVPADEKDEAWMNANLQKLGGEEAYGTFAEGWGWAMNSPLRWYKHHPSMLGGIRNGMIVSWTGRVGNPGAICEQFSHLVDVVPTLYEVAGLPAPRVVNGVEQKPLDGQSLLSSFNQCVPDAPKTQYFEIGGMAGLFHNGWFISNDMVAGENAESWSLYDLRKDYSQSKNLSGKYPEKVNELAALWQSEAERNNVFPILDDWKSGAANFQFPARERRYEFWGNDGSIPAHPNGLLQGLDFIGSFTLDVELDIAAPGASGVIAALGSHFAGWALYLEEGYPVFDYVRSTRPEDRSRIKMDKPLPAGTSHLKLRFARAGTGIIGPAKVTIFAGESKSVTGDVPMSFFLPLGVGEQLDVARDTGVQVSQYAVNGGVLQGEVRRLTLLFD